MISKIAIAQAEPADLVGIYNSLIVTRMKMDREFSNFLDNVDLPESDIDTPEWFYYKTRVVDYGEVNELISTTEYYIKKYGQSCAI